MKQRDRRLIEEYTEIVLSGRNPGRKEFFYGVRSTGIFCRPGCPSRRPNPENLVIFRNIGEAENAGFRPCKRCRPTETVDETIPKSVIQACRLIEESINETGEEISLEDLAFKAELSPAYFQKLFKRTTGISPKEYAMGLKARKFRTLLSRSRNITEALYEAGYGSSSRVYEKTGRMLSMTPSQYKNAGQDQRIHFAVAPCALGFIAAAFTEQGVCSIDLGGGCG